MDKSTAQKFKKQSTSNWTDSFTLIYGSYKWLNDAPIHYCLTSLSVKNLWEDVRLMSEIPGVEKWGFEALFQRVISDKRVDAIKLQYLEDKNRFKFFPPVTIAMLPCSEDNPLRDYDNISEFEFNSPDNENWEASLPGLNIALPTATTGKFPAFGQPAIIKWDKKKFVAIAIDGQHRISALRKLIPRESQSADSKDLPATILVFDPKLPKGRDLIQVTREIFIDINKNAKKVDESRLILLDDRNFYNSLTRKLILQAYPNGETPTDVAYIPISDETPLEILNGIPQELIDTAMGREASDVGKLKPWQYTSAFILNRAIQYFSFENHFKKFEDLVNTSDYHVDSDDEMEAAVAERREIYNDDGEDEIISDQDMLSFRPTITEILVEKTARMHRGLWLGPFTAFKPYKDHILRFKSEINSDHGDKLRSYLLSEGSFPGKHDFNSRAPIELSQDKELFKKIKKSVKKIYKPEGWEDSLVWYSVFQRGLVFQPNLLRYALDAANGKELGSRQEFAAFYTKQMNMLFEEGWFLRKKKVAKFSVWSGIAMKTGESGELLMDGSDGAAKRTGCYLRLMACALVAKSHGGFSHLEPLLHKKGLSSACTMIEKGYQRHLKLVDGISGKSREPEDYKTDAKEHLKNVLEEISTDQL